MPVFKKLSLFSDGLPGSDLPYVDGQEDQLWSDQVK